MMQSTLDTRLAASTTAFAAVLALSMSAYAQQVAGVAVDDLEEIDEIVVIGGDRPGDPTDHEPSYEDVLREQLIEDLERLEAMRDRDNEWRNYTTTSVNSSTRMSWGYDAEAESRMRRDTDLMDVQYETTKPASVFRVGF